MAGALLAGALTGCVPGARPAPQSGPYIIEDDGGGNLVAAMVDRDRLARWGGPVEIAGECASACTIFASLPNACLRPESRLAFHAAADPQSGRIWPRANAFLQAFYRGDIATRFAASWSQSRDLHVISAQEAVRLDPGLRLCPPAAAQ